MAVLVGTFKSVDEADDAVTRLKAAGVSDGELSLITRTGDAVDPPSGEEQRGHRSMDLAAVGAMAGAVVGGALLGPVGAVIGGMAAGGGLAAALNSRGVERADAEEYERRLSEGQHVVAVEATGREDTVRAILAGAGADHIAVDR